MYNQREGQLSAKLQLTLNTSYLRMQSPIPSVSTTPFASIPSMSAPVLCSSNNVTKRPKIFQALVCTASHGTEASSANSSVTKSFQPRPRSTGTKQPAYSYSPSALHIAHVNLQDMLCSLSRGLDMHWKLDELCVLLLSADAPHVMCINETWLSDNVDSSELRIKHYDIIRQDKNCHGGGAAIYANEQIQYSHLDIDFKRYPGLEVCAIEVSCVKSMVNCGVYRPPSSKAASLATFHDFLGESHPRTKDAFLLGDFNFDLLKDYSFSTNVCLMYDLKQLINKPTRIAKTSSTLLDHMYVPRVCCVGQFDVKNIHISYHCLVSCTVGKNLQTDNLRVNNRRHRSAQYLH